MPRTSTRILLVLLVLALGLTLWLGYRYTDQRDRLRDEGFATARMQASTAAAQISEAFAELMVIAEDIARDLSDGTLAYVDILDRMQDETRVRPDIDGLAITFEPFAYSSDLRLFQTYVFRGEDGFDVLEGATYDYSRPPTAEIDTSWYYDTVNEGAQWHEPFFAAGAQKILVEYGVPFTAVGVDEIAGIVSIDYTLDDVGELMDDLQLGATGYGFVLSDQGTFLAHPVADFVVNRNIFAFANGNDPLAEAAHDAVEIGNRSFVETTDAVTGETVWYFFEPIGSTGWTIGIVLNKSQFQPDPQQTMRDQMTLALAAASVVFLAATTIFHVDRFHFTNFWAVSAVFSLLSVALIVLAWVQINRLQTVEGVSITDQAALDRFVHGIESPPGTFARPLEIPTGIMIQSMQFPDPTSVTVNGFIWQRYPVDAGVMQGFALPQRIGEEATLEEVQRETRDGVETIVWYIGVTLRQNYDTTRYPFDHRDIQIRITPVDLAADIILTPDITAYDLVTPRLLPGVDSGASINNWRLRSSYFSYSEEAMNPALLATSMERFRLPELRFVVQAQRVYMGPFIAYLLPGLIAAAMTFAYLVSGRQSGQMDEIVNALNYAAALFFVVAVIHTALRDQIAAVGVTYMEYVYILLYVAIVFVAANIFWVARFPDWAIVRYRDNLMPKVLYWPVFAGVLLLATLLIFVY